jgi:hypothetical protein
MDLPCRPRRHVKLTNATPHVSLSTFQLSLPSFHLIIFIRKNDCGRRKNRDRRCRTVKLTPAGFRAPLPTRAQSCQANSFAPCDFHKLAQLAIHDLHFHPRHSTPPLPSSPTASHHYLLFLIIDNAIAVQHHSIPSFIHHVSLSSPAKHDPTHSVFPVAWSQPRTQCIPYSRFLVGTSLPLCRHPHRRHPRRRRLIILACDVALHPAQSVLPVACSPLSLPHPEQPVLPIKRICTGIPIAALPCVT